MHQNFNFLNLHKNGIYVEKNTKKHIHAKFYVTLECDLYLWPMISKNQLTQGTITTANVCAKLENRSSSAFWVIVFTPFIWQAEWRIYRLVQNQIW